MEVEVEDLKFQLPKPPLPPSKIIFWSPSAIVSYMILLVSVSLITVPTGTLIRASLPSAPVLLLPLPSPP